MSHLTYEQIIRLAELHAEGLLYDEDSIKAFQHIRECEECYKDFCCAAAIYAATLPETIARILPIDVGQPSLAEVLIARAKAVIRVMTETVANTITVTMEQIGDRLSGWSFEPSMAFAGSRGAEGEETASTAALEDVDSRYTFVRFNAETGELHIQIDTEEAAVVPESITLKFPDGHTVDLEIQKGDRFVIADTKNLPGKNFEIIFS